MPHPRQEAKTTTPHMQKRGLKSTAVNQDIDIIEIILEDHKPLKKLCKVMKSEDAEFEEKTAAFEEFAPLLIAHAKPEEQVLYTFLKEDEDLRAEGFEGDVEHGLADQMIEDAKRTKDQDLFEARIKVLAELVEHHLKEEETEVFPDFKKHSNKDERREMGHEYLDVKANFEELDEDQAH